MIELTVPSKTFLVGEYAILFGAQALIAAHKPTFAFTAVASQEPQGSLFHPQSAASRWFKSSEVLLKDWQVTVTDPHHGSGGFGASGAQFVFYHLLSTYLQSGRTEDDVNDAWQDFRACDTSRGSGADVVAQSLGGITAMAISNSLLEAKSYEWPFEEADFFVFPTGVKIETHAHLQSLKYGDFSNLMGLSDKSVSSFFATNIEGFVAGLADYQRELSKKDLLAAGSMEKLEQFAAMPGVLTVKGCGAMGADTLLAIVDRDAREEFLSEAARLKIQPSGSNLQLAPPSRLKVG